MQVLVLTSEPISGGQLRHALGEDAGDDIEVMVVAPALHASALRFWMGDADEAIARAEAVSRQAVERLGSEGVPASGDTGEGDPEQAVEDALRTFDADRIVVFTHPESEQRYLEDTDDQELERRFGRPVVRADISEASGG